MCWSCVVKISSASKLVPNLFLPRSIVCSLHQLVQPKVDITQADAVPKCDTVEVEKQIEVMEKSCQPQTEQMCNPPKKQPTQEKVHQEKCLHHDDKGNMVHASTHPAPTYSG